MPRGAAGERVGQDGSALLSSQGPTASLLFASTALAKSRLRGQSGADHGGDLPRRKANRERRRRRRLKRRRRRRRPRQLRWLRPQLQQQRLPTPQR